VTKFERREAKEKPQMRQIISMLLLILLPLTLVAQQRETIPVANWLAPLY
jgi:hypothetical protein